MEISPEICCRLRHKVPALSLHAEDPPGGRQAGDLRREAGVAYLGKYSSLLLRVLRPRSQNQ